MQNNSELPRFKQVQYAFTQHVRNPDKHPRPSDIEARRMKIYNDLLFNNVEDFMCNGFPVLREITPDDKWQRMIRDYFERHQSTTPLFPEMTREFLRYLEHEREPEDDDYPFMLELAHYEWVELAVSISDQEPDFTSIKTDGDLLEGTPVLSPLAWPLSYQYAVHKIGPDYLPAEPEAQPTFLVVYRDMNDQVHFLEINPVTAHLLQQISEETTLTAKQILTEIAQHLNHPNPEVVIQGGLQILHDLKTRGVILGVKETQ